MKRNEGMNMKRNEGMNVKRIVCTLLSLVLAIGLLGGCGSKKAATDNAPISFSIVTAWPHC